MKAIYNFYPSNSSDTLIAITADTALNGYPATNLKTFKPSLSYRTRIKDEDVSKSFEWTDEGKITDYGIYCLCDLGSDIILAGTFNGDILKSTDGGFNWSVVESTGLLMLNSIVDMGSGVVLVCGDDNTSGTGKIYRSTDSGSNWSEITLNVEHKVYLTKMIEIGNDCAIAIVKTTAVEFLPSIIITRDAGLTWESLSIEAKGGITSDSIRYSGFTSAYKISDGKVILGGYDFCYTEDYFATYLFAPYKYYSLDGVNITKNYDLFPYLITAIEGIDTNILIAGTDNTGNILKSLDGGLTWRDLGRINDHVTRINAFFNNGTGLLFCVGNYNKIFQSKDYGDTWFDTGELDNALSIQDIIKTTADDYLLATTYLTNTTYGGRIYSGEEDDLSVSSDTIIKYTIDSSIRSYDSIFINRINFAEFYLEGSTDDSTWEEIIHVENLTRDEVYITDSTEQNKPDEYIHYLHLSSSSLTYQYLRLRIPAQTPVFGVGIFQIGNFLIGNSVDITNPKTGFSIEYIKKTNASATEGGFISEYKSGRTRRIFVGSFDKISKTDYNRIKFTDAPFILYLDFNNPEEAYLVRATKNYSLTFEEVAENASIPFGFEEIV